MAYLIGLEGKQEGETIALNRHKTTFGRSAECHVTLPDKKVSRNHACILLTRGPAVLIDLGSSNGTQVNGLPVQKTFLNAGDRVEIGDNVFLYYEGRPEKPDTQERTVREVSHVDLESVDQSRKQDELATELRTIQDRSAIFEALESTYLQLRTLFTLSRELPRADGPSEVFSLAADSLQLATGATRLMLWLREGDTLADVPTFVETADGPADAPPPDSFPRAILDWVEEQRRPLLLASGVGPIGAEALPKYPLIVLPVETATQRVGVIAVERIGRTENFLKRDLDFAQAACGVLALVLAEGTGDVTPQAAVESERFGDIIVGQSPAMRELIAETMRVAEVSSSVLIRGESGTGKELIARTVHQLSGRSRGPFVAVNCGAITPTLIESELFGHEKGAFTGAHARKIGQFEVADGGTIFLDEISELPLDAQVKFLRVLQEGEFYRVGGNRAIRVDVRVIAATNRDLEAMISENRFREDLYFRLNVVELQIQPLRERREDIPPLAEHFFRELRRQIPTQIDRISPHALNALRGYDWPGNVRQLRNAIEHALVMGEGKLLRLKHLPDYVTLSVTAEHSTQDEGPPGADTAPLSLAEVEKRHIAAVLRKCNGNKQRAASILGISRSTLYEKTRLYEIE